MMKVAVRYFSKSSNTRKVAKVIAETAKAELGTVDEPIGEPIDLLFLGSGIYAGNVSAQARNFIDHLTPQLVKKVIFFSTSAGSGDAYEKTKEMLERNGIMVDPLHFNCRGKFLLMHRNKPDQNDFENARKFTEQVLRNQC